MAPAIIRRIIWRHGEEIALLSEVRRSTVDSFASDLGVIGALDARIEAHADALQIAGPAAIDCAMEALARPGFGECFLAAVALLEGGQREPLEKALDAIDALGDATGPAASGCLAGFAWTSSSRLRGVVSAMLGSPSVFRRALALATCAEHGVNPGPCLAEGVHDASPGVRVAAQRALFRLGQPEMLSLSQHALDDPDGSCRLEAAIAAVRLGDRDRGLERLRALAIEPSRYRVAALEALIPAIDPLAARAVLAETASSARDERLLLAGAARDGDPYYVPWMLERMMEPANARLAASAFTLITGFEVPGGARPDAIEAPASRDSAESVIHGAEESNLEWPDQMACERWWKANGHRFQEGVRYLAGDAPTREHCLDLLAHASQRARIAAAYQLALFVPSSRAFNVRAPAWWQTAALRRLA